MAAEEKKFVTPTTEDNYNYHNKEIEALAADNPANKYQYTPGWLDKIGNFFGFRTAQDKFEDEKANKAADIEAQLKAIDREEHYNSAEEQAQRMRDAGINPNLQGGVDAGAASEFDDQANAGMETPKDEMQTIRESGRNAVATLLNIFSTGAGLMATGMDIKTAKADLYTQAFNAVKEFVINHPDDSTEDAVKALKESGMLDNYLTGRKKDAQLTSLVDNAKLALNNIFTSGQTKEGIAKLKSHPYYNEDINTMTKNWAPISAAIQNLAEASTNSELSKKQVEERFNGAFKKLAKELMDKADQGDMSALALLNTMMSSMGESGLENIFLFGLTEGLAQWKSGNYKYTEEYVEGLSNGINSIVENAKARREAARQANEEGYETKRTRATRSASRSHNRTHRGTGHRNGAHGTGTRYGVTPTGEPIYHEKRLGNPHKRLGRPQEKPTNRFSKWWKELWNR